MRRLSLKHLPVLCGLAVSALLGSPTSAEAALRLCNDTSYVLHVAAAYQQGVASKTEGWVEVLPGDCESALADLPAEAQAFVYAKSDSAHAGKGLVFDGSERFCVAADLSRFTVEGRRDCRRRGYVEADLTPVADASGRRTVTFTEKDDFGRRRARMAGTQRLLTDLQYEVGTIDGFGGERTREAEAAYKLRYRVDKSKRGADLLSALVRTARDEAGRRGLSLCNQSAFLVWAASGMLRDDRFESRGWTRVPAGACAQLINQNLNDRYYFYYAEAVDEKGRPVMEAGRQKVWSGDIGLCTKSTRFVITGDNDCQARGFDRRGFAQIDTGSARQWKVNLE
ncbi:MAG: DUF1036 domain-containing protein [Parvibaculales bacterium]